MLLVVVLGCAGVKWLDTRRRAGRAKQPNLTQGGDTQEAVVNGPSSTDTVGFTNSTGLLAATDFPCTIRTESVSFHWSSRLRRACSACRRTNHPGVSNISTCFPPGSFTAILGPSGACKSTLLRLLSGEVSPDAGAVFVNGHKVGAAWLRRAVGLAPQFEESVDSFLTAREAFAAVVSLHGPQPGSPTPVHSVTAMLDTLAIGHVADMPVSVLSGGQRKRVSIGMELLRSPVALLLDEYTSGLDSTTAASLTNLLRTVAHSSRTPLIAVIHQASQHVFNSFDNVIVMQTGRVVFTGPPSAIPAFMADCAWTYSGTCSVPDALLDMLTDELVPPLQPAPPTAVESQHVLGRTALPHLPSSFFSLRAQLVLQVRRVALREAEQAGRTLVLLAGSLLSGLFLGLAFVDPKFRLPIPESIAATCPNAVNDLTDGSPWNRPCNVDWPAAEVQGFAIMLLTMMLPVLGVSASLSAASPFARGIGRSAAVRWHRLGMSAVLQALVEFVVEVVKVSLVALAFTAGYVTLSSPYGSYWGYYAVLSAFLFATWGFSSCAAVSLPLSAHSTTTMLVFLFLTSSAVLSGLVLNESSPSATPPFLAGEALFRVESQIVFDHLAEYGKNGSYVQQYAGAVYGYEVMHEEVIHDNIVLLACYGVAARLLTLLWFRLRVVSTTLL